MKTEQQLKDDFSSLNRLKENYNYEQSAIKEYYIDRALTMNVKFFDALKKHLASKPRTYALTADGKLIR